MDFVIDTLFQVFFAFFWIIGILVFLIKKKNKKKYIFLILLIPPLLMWTVYSYINILEPRFKDIRYYNNKDYEITSGKCSSVKTNSRGMTPSFILDEDTYYYNPRTKEVKEDKTYKIKYLPNSKYVIDLEVLE
ncbi:hypothetical protein GOQ29_08685 [Clostridium sp. D2Q-14]|uniref:hypothetical protein n=1 Tax=Anaeromonas gelatinilytica TaxID=2683194 RepID=UPI00193C83EA|nr:hypothetical protein [Anaeromonas gelatinilytica]MBS4535691.1 hypothetical protein [Anaeromonas gelatinilytica]